MARTKRKTKVENTQQRIESALREVMKTDGALAIALVERDDGMVAGKVGDAGFDLDYACAGNARFLKGKRDLAQELKVQGELIETMHIFPSQLHLIRPLTSDRTLFAYFVLDSSANLALARRALAKMAEDLKV